MNYIKQVAEMLGVEIGEEFKIKYKENLISSTAYYVFNDDGLYFVNDGNYIKALDNITARLIYGKYEIVKIPFKPKKGEKYWTCLFIKDGYIALETWCGCSVDYCHWKLGNCFRTREEAETKGKEIMGKIKAEYDG